MTDLPRDYAACPATRRSSSFKPAPAPWPEVHHPLPRFLLCTPYRLETSLLRSLHTPFSSLVLHLSSLQAHIRSNTCYRQYLFTLRPSFRKQPRNHDLVCTLRSRSDTNRSYLKHCYTKGLPNIPRAKNTSKHSCTLLHIDFCFLLARRVRVARIGRQRSSRPWPNKRLSSVTQLGKQFHRLATLCPSQTIHLVTVRARP